MNRGPLPYQGSALPLSYVGELFMFSHYLPMERVMGIEPTSSAWKAEVLPLNYTRPSIIFLVSSFRSRTNILTVLSYQTVGILESIMCVFPKEQPIHRLQLLCSKPGCVARIINLNGQNASKQGAESAAACHPISGGGGRIRTYVGLASRFTVCPR